MATPDPFIDELRIMSYSSRPRACKELYKVPRRTDFIEVLWCLDDIPGLPHTWCAAEVLHVYDGNNPEMMNRAHEDQYLAKGIILYLPGETWDEQVDEVEFLDGHKLRCSAKDTDGTPSQTDGAKTIQQNPSIRWRFRQQTSQNCDDDDEWTSTCISGPGRENALLRANIHNEERGVLGVEVKALRDGHASLTVELEKVKRELIGVTHHLRTFRNQSDQYQMCTNAHCVFPRLRHKLGLRMQAGLKQSSATLGKRKTTEPDQASRSNIVDGLYVDVLKARVECTLRQFESVSRRIKTGCGPDSVHFAPDFAYTQLPSECSTEFRILFKTFSQICEAIGIMSITDKKEMSRKCGKGSNGDILRLVGTYAIDENNDKSPSNFFPGTSCGTATPQLGAVAPSHESDEIKADQLFPILTRKKREWNTEDCRFVHKIRLQKTKLPSLADVCTQR